MSEQIDLTLNDTTPEATSKKVNDDVLATITNKHKDVCFSTALIDITFKKANAGDTVVDGGRGFFANNMVNATADQMCQAIARNIHDIQALVFGSEAIAQGTTSELKDTFDASGKLNVQFAKTKTDAQIMRAEVMYASLNLYWTSLVALAEAHAEHMPSRDLHYAYVSSAAATSKYKQGPLTDFREAIKFRLNNISARKAIFALAKRITEGKVQMQNVNNSSAASALNI